MGQSTSRWRRARRMLVRVRVRAHLPLCAPACCCCSPEAASRQDLGGNRTNWPRIRPFDPQQAARAFPVGAPRSVWDGVGAWTDVGSVLGRPARQDLVDHVEPGSRSRSGGSVAAVSRPTRRAGFDRPTRVRIEPRGADGAWMDRRRTFRDGGWCLKWGFGRARETERGAGPRAEDTPQRSRTELAQKAGDSSESVYGHS